MIFICLPIIDWYVEMQGNQSEHGTIFYSQPAHMRLYRSVPRGLVFTLIALRRGLALFFVEGKSWFLQNTACWFKSVQRFFCWFDFWYLFYREKNPCIIFQKKQVDSWLSQNFCFQYYNSSKQHPGPVARKTRVPPPLPEFSAWAWAGCAQAVGL